MEKIKSLYKQYKTSSLFVVIFSLVGYIVYPQTAVIATSAIQSIQAVEKETVKAEKVLEKIDKNIEVERLKPKKLQACTRQEVKLIIGESRILDEMNLFIIDLNLAKFVSDTLTTDYHTKKTIYGVKRELIANSQMYMMYYEPIDNLKYNKKEYAKYLKRHKKSKSVKDEDLLVE